MIGLWQDYDLDGDFVAFFSLWSKDNPGCFVGIWLSIKKTIKKSKKHGDIMIVNKMVMIDDQSKSDDFLKKNVFSWWSKHHQIL